ncbi:MAG: hypothetical protein HUJ51_02935 [Eggerthellaceae bacterium]|nr:hypothetical protein [Eggerthellaceae bacterium]
MITKEFSCLGKDCAAHHPVQFSHESDICKDSLVGNGMIFNPNVAPAL